MPPLKLISMGACPLGQLQMGACPLGHVQWGQLFRNEYLILDYSPNPDFHNPDSQIPFRLISVISDLPNPDSPHNCLIISIELITIRLVPFCTTHGVIALR